LMKKNAFHQLSLAVIKINVTLYNHFIKLKKFLFSSILT
jgi:hypothetical protein